MSYTEPSVSALEEEGERVITELGKLGISSSYELARGTTPVISMGLTEAAHLVNRINGLYELLEKTVKVGQKLGDYVAYLETEGSAGEEPDAG